MNYSKDDAGKQLVGEGTGVRMSLVLTVAAGLLAHLLWLMSALGGIREGIQNNSSQIATLKELVTVQLRVAEEDTSEVRSDL